MIYKIVLTESYYRRERKFLRKHPLLINRYKKVLQMLRIDPFHKALRLHEIKGKGENVYSVSINLSYRLLVEFLIKDNEIILVDIGNHDSIYSL